ncbi:unnamed protein product [Pedinophyceae sp. YPF-701]|nr:unnamed protein product [Pedinophyceae sp. YPF-701]
MAEGARPAVPAAGPLARRIARVIDGRLEAPEMVGALRTLSSLYDGDAATDDAPARKTPLRTHMKERALALHDEYLEAAKGPLKALEEAGQLLDAIEACCAALTRAAQTSQAASAPLLSEQTRLQQELARIDARAREAADFQTRFLLSAEDARAARQGPVGPAFFRALARTREVHGNCRALLATQHKRPAMELMDAMAQHQDAAYELLTRWLQAECRALGEAEGRVAPTPIVLQAVAALRDRPVLLRCCLDEAVQARQARVFERFIAALSRGEGARPPIEHRSDDPVRYVGDMLAWVHGAATAEKELAGALAGADGAAAPQQQGTAPGELTDRALRPAVRALQVRIEQVLASKPPLGTLLRLVGALARHRGMLAPVTGAEGELCGALEACQASATEMLERSAVREAHALLDRAALPASAAALGTPPEVSACVRLLTSLAGDAQAGAARDSATDAALEAAARAVLSPLVHCDRVAAAVGEAAAGGAGEGGAARVAAQQGRVARCVAGINCLSAVHTPLSAHPALRAAVAPLSERVDRLIAELAAAEAGVLLGGCGLQEIVGRMEEFQRGGPDVAARMSAAPELSLSRVTGAMRGLAARVSMPDAMPEFRQIEAPHLRSRAVDGVVHNIASAYGHVYATLESDAGYQAAGGVGGVRHSPDELRGVLSGGS